MVKVPKIPQFTYERDVALQRQIEAYVSKGCRQTGFTRPRFKALLIRKAIELNIMNISLELTEADLEIMTQNGMKHEKH